MLTNIWNAFEKSIQEQGEKQLKIKQKVKLKLQALEPMENVISDIVSGREIIDEIKLIK